MSTFQYQLKAGSTITLQSGFTREVETVTTVVNTSDGSSFVFNLAPSGPILFQTLGAAPLAAGTLTIAESANAADIVDWIYAEVNSATFRTFTLPARQSFKQFIPVNGPFIGLQLTGTSTLNVEADGLIGWAPSTVVMGPPELVNIFLM